jgi:hypothetical protein
MSEPVRGFPLRLPVTRRSGSGGPDGGSRHPWAPPTAQLKCLVHFSGIAPIQKHVTSMSTVTPKSIVCHAANDRPGWVVMAGAASSAVVTMSCHAAATLGHRSQPTGYELGERSALISGSKSVPSLKRDRKSDAHETGELTC